MDFTKNDLKNLENLARIEISEEDEVKISEQLKKILTYFEKINELDLENILPMKNIRAEKMALREDISKESLDNDTALENAPESKYGFFVVPQVIKND